MAVGTVGGTEVRVLGPIEVWHGGRRIQLGRRQQRLVLGFLAVEANRVVPGERLIELLWGDDPPRRARAVVQSRVCELRAALGSGSGSGSGSAGTIGTVGGGYVLRIEPEQVDAHRAGQLMRAARGAGEPRVARAMLRQALGLFRGRAFDGWVPPGAGAPVVANLEAARLTGLEDLFELEVRHGDPGEVVDELAAQATANPARERLTASLMVALDRMGRRSEALRAYHRCRRRLVTELGIEPGRGLQDLHRDLLRGDAAPVGPAPNTLPADLADFTGRAAERAELPRLLASARVVAITGPGGVGKTALSVHSAHSMRSRFPDGLLFAALRGSDGAPADPAAVLGRLLRALGVGRAAVPDGVDDRIDLYRCLLTERRVLVLLDDATSADQVRPLIPGGQYCAALVTARPRLAAALGAAPMELGLPAPGVAADLLARIAGEQRIRREPEAAADLARLCGYLPLALRVAGARLAAKPHWSVERLVARVGGARRRLDEHCYGTLDVRASIDRSYTGLTIDAQRLLCRLGDAALPEVDAATCAALLHRPVADAETALELLHDAHLLEVRGRDRYRLNHLVRLYARERADLDRPARPARAAHTAHTA